MDDDKANASERKPGEQQSDAANKANKPDEARAKDTPNAGNILGGVQPASK